MEREKEIERLQQRCKVLGEAVERLSGAKGEWVDAVELDVGPMQITKAALADHEQWYKLQRKEMSVEPEQTTDIYDFENVPSPLVSPFPRKLRAKVDNAKRRGKKKRSKTKPNKE